MNFLVIFAKIVDGIRLMSNQRSVNIFFTALYSCTSIGIRHSKGRFEEKIMDVQADRGKRKRDAFFYYLFVANIVLLVIVGVLVFGAVRIVYFG